MFVYTLALFPLYHLHTAANQYTPEIDIFTPVLTIIELTANDALAGTAIATYTSGIQTLINRGLRNNGNVILLANGARTDVTPAVHKPYIDALRSLAISNGCVYAGYYNRHTISQLSTSGLLYDMVHPNSAGHYDMSEFLYNVLFRK